MTTKTAFQYSHTIGFLANQGRGFNNPVDVAMDSQGVLYVVSRGGPELDIRLHYKRVTMCTVDEEYLGEFSTGGTDDGGLWWPSAIAIDSQDNIYIADEALQRVSVFTKRGKLLDQWGAQGSRDGELDRPSAMAFDAEDNLYLTDSLNHRVQKFTKDGQVSLPSGVRKGTGPDSSICLGASRWTGRATFTSPTGGTTGCRSSTPRDVSLPNGTARAARTTGSTVRRAWPWTTTADIYVCDWGNERVQVLSPAGETLTSFRGDSITSTWSRAYFEANPEEGAARLASDLEPEVGAVRGTLP